MSIRCSYKNCSNTVPNSPHLSFFRFPKDPVRSALWVDYCGREDFKEKTVKWLHTQRKICEEHFEDVMFRNNVRNRLKDNAYPKIYNDRKSRKEDSQFISLENKCQKKPHEVYIVETNSEVGEEVTDNDILSNSFCNGVNEINDEVEINKSESIGKFENNTSKIVFKDINEIINGAKSSVTRLSTTRR